ncbi:hypothetical protein ACFWBS_12290 [Streptomyces mirabilis]|uniref:hypothetical protein n=1 Tax=Streptomyces mirabilis TaxID=68239 RepID=UPI0036482BD1
MSTYLHRLRGVREHLAAKRDHYRALADGLGVPHSAWGEHLDRARVLEAEHGRVCARIRHLNQALAWAAARWAVDQAAALGASVIYLEDLTTLETRGHRRGNAVTTAIPAFAARWRIASATVPRTCPDSRAGAGSRWTGITPPPAGSSPAACSPRPTPSPTAPPAPGPSAPRWRAPCAW